ncbi:transglycosylase domain-containing protein [Streptomyces sp. NBC_00932]|uniref:transglycosylase domain-containing protein n=1 Tax=Streptomyces sp. NBC_00932 TaxID=2903690 RepID=UPI00386E33BF|nr:penicillin-binding protein [Streptomyces sp. NBC_00932]
MSEHRRKPPQPQSGGRAAARRDAQQPSGRRAAPPRTTTGSPSGSQDEEERPYGGRAEARRAAQRSGGGRRRAAEAGGGRGGRRGAGGGGRGGRGGRGSGPEGGGGRGPNKKRFIDYPRANQYGWRHWVPSWRLVTGLFVGFVGSILAAGTIAYAMVGIPDANKTSQAQNNVYYWSDGSQMVATGGEINRQIVPLSQIPSAMQNSVVSAENKSFYKDKGVDPMGIARAVFNMAKGGETQGGSTITQQYVKNSRLGQEQTLSRKFKELFISIKVGAKMHKSDIMSDYLNTSYYGRGAYGIQAAARTYFGVDSEKLNPSQCAFLATLLKGASYFDPAGAVEIDPAATPKANLQRATNRWRWILDEMVKDGRLPAAERAKYKTFPKVDPPKKDAQLGGQTGYLVDLAKSYFVNNNKQGITSEDLAKGGYQIHTTFDKKKVKALETSVEKVRKAKIKPGQRPKTDTHVQFGGASVNAQTGAIAAIYGGEDATKHYTNNADYTGAQVGSTFKPFVLAAALEYGKRNPTLGKDQPDSDRTLVSPKSLYSGQNDLKIRNFDGSVWKNKADKEWLQQNDGKESVGKAPDYAIDLREAMRESVNSAYVQLGMDVGTDKVRQAAIDAGLRDDKQSMASSDYPSFSIGTSSPSAIRMAGAYATFANNGRQNEPFSVTKVTSEGRTVYQHSQVEKSAFSTAIASNVTDVLKTVVDKGTGTAARIPGRQVAGKTGTTDGNKSAWFIGYTPQLSTAIDMYRFDDNAKGQNRQFEEMYGTGGEEKIHGASFPAQIWHSYMTQALNNTPSTDFPAPEPIGKVVYGGGVASPKPTPVNTPSPTPSPSSPSPSPSDTPSPTPSPTESCNKWKDWTCGNDGGTDAGTDSGTDGGPTPSPSDTSDTGGQQGGGGGGGGLFGGGG